MTWIQTFSGGRFWPMEPRSEHVDVRDIAHSLAMQCRFNGHCREFYSVAEHCVRVSRAVDDGASSSARSLALWGLLHDAAEAYVGDLPRPVKKQFPMFEEAEDRLLEVIVRKFGLGWPMPPEVRAADDTLLMTECRDLLCPAPVPWRIEGVAPLETRIEPVSPQRAEEMYLARFAELTR